MVKKRILLASLPIAAILIALMLGQHSFSQADYGNDFNVSDTTLVKYVGNSTEVVIPEGITCIGQEAFADNGVIKSVTLPDTVETIEYAAFQNCKALETVILPDSVRIMDNSVFYGCDRLKNVHIGSGLERLGCGVFADCISLETVQISGSNPNFICSDGVIMDKEKTIVYQYLPGRNGTNYRMPDTVNEIKRYAFWGCDELQHLILPGALEELGEYSLTNCSSLQTLTILEPTCNIGLKAVEGCIALKQVEVPTSMISIHESAFDLCPQDLLFVCEEGTYGENYALEHGFRVSTETILEPWGEETESTEEDTQDETTNNEENDDVQQNDGAVPVIDGRVLDGTVIVSDRAFLHVDGLSVNTGTIEETIAETQIGIEDYAHYNQKDLTQYDFSVNEQGITYIGELAFARSNLTEIIIPEGVTAIGYAAFYHCDSLENVSIPSSVTRVDALAFAHTPWYENWLNDETASDFLIVGDGVLIAYKGQASEVILPEEVKHIGDYVFAGHDEIQFIRSENDTP